MENVSYKAIVEEIFQAWIPKEPISTQIGPQPQGTPCQRLPEAAGAYREKGRDTTINVLARRKQDKARETYHHEEHEGHEVELHCEIFRALRVLHGGQIL